VNRPLIDIYICFDMIPFKPLFWRGDSLDRVRELAPEVQNCIGFELWKVQQGNEPSDWKPMSIVGSGVNELRIHTEGESRVLYVAKFATGVYVLHVFGKKTQQTQKHDIDLATKRYRELAFAMRKTHS